MSALVQLNSLAAGGTRKYLSFNSLTFKLSINFFAHFSLCKCILFTPDSLVSTSYASRVEILKLSACISVQSFKLRKWWFLQIPQLSRYAGWQVDSPGVISVLQPVTPSSYQRYRIPRDYNPHTPNGVEEWWFLKLQPDKTNIDAEPPTVPAGCNLQVWNL